MPLSEYGEVHTSVGSVFHKVWMLFEVVVFAVFKDKKSVRFQQLILEDEVRYLCQLFQSIRRVGKDEVELLSSAVDVAQGVAADRDTFVGLDLLHDVADEGVVLAVFLDGDDTVASA